MVAATLGIMLGVLLTLLSERAVTHVTPDDPMRGLAMVSVMMGVRFGLAILTLGLFYFFARDGLAPFGIALALAFIAGLMLETVRMLRTRTPETPA